MPVKVSFAIWELVGKSMPIKLSSESSESCGSYTYLELR